jgi:hypothetical protein
MAVTLDASEAVGNIIFRAHLDARHFSLATNATLRATKITFKGAQLPVSGNAGSIVH